MHLEIKKIQTAGQKIEEKKEEMWKGIVKKAEEKKESYCLFLEIPKQGQVLIKWKKSEHAELSLHSYDWVDHTIVVKGKLSELEESPNDGGFDEKEYYASLGVYAKIENAKIIKISKTDSSVKIYMAKVQEYLRNILRKITRDKERGILQGILLGDKSELDQETKFLYQNNGISHILSISGLHISILGVTWYRLLRRRFGYGLSGGIAMFLVVSFGIMVGNGSATLRAVLMLGVLLFGNFIGRTYDGLSSVGFALLLMTWEMPYYMTNQGFWLSISAMAGIYLFYPVFHQFLPDGNYFLKQKKEGMLGEKGTKIQIKIKKKLAENFWFSFSIQTAAIPIICKQYFVIPVYGILLNLVVLPVFSILVGVAFSSVFVGIFSVPVASCLMLIPEAILQFYEWICQMVLNLPGAILCTGMGNGKKMLLYYAGLGISLIFFHCYGSRTREKIPWWWVRVFRKLLLVSVVTGLFYLSLVSKREENVSVHMLDVGQGDGMVVETRKHHAILIDGGSSSVKELATYRLIPFLLSHGYQEVEGVFLSHMDADHINGIVDILQDPYQQIQIKNIYLADIEPKDDYQKVTEAAKGKARIIYLKEGDCCKIDGILFEMQYPAFQQEEFADANEKSMVLKMKYQNITGLFTGDAQASFEKRYIQNGEKIDFLKVSHHGSKNATSEEFLKIARPSAAFVSAGIRNRYGHPSKEVLDRLNRGNVLLYNTQDCGQITMKITDESEMILGKKLDRKKKGLIQ